MKWKDLKWKTDKELTSLLIQERENLRKMRFQITAGQLTNTSQVKKTKRIIARILTLLKEKHA